MFNEILKKLRLEKGLSQKQLADKIGTSQAAVYYWESGKRKPNFDTIQKLSVALDTNPLYLSGNVADYSLNEFNTEISITEAFISITKEIFGEVELKMIEGEKGNIYYYLIGDKEKQFAISEIDFGTISDNLMKYYEKAIKEKGHTEKEEIEICNKILNAIKYK